MSLSACNFGRTLKRSEKHSRELRLNGLTVVADQLEHAVALCPTSNLRVFHRDKADYGGHKLELVA
jgi:hypothetical protein